ncbi:TetR/AcrR family transcriptional regulator [Rhodococcus zopfii]|uniref:TetR/AcrR family transcriptional regulator n=1 Tax=Rhodococcus zopfii TaxID=43772 RepID=A0ABU3WWQ8_9NOCA|nr:TetR/AcrR family transcriptional regulator [Rhodococcus zopfii]
MPRCTWPRSDECDSNRRYRPDSAGSRSPAVATLATIVDGGSRFAVVPTLRSDGVFVVPTDRAPARLTQQQRTAISRTRILDAAVDVLARQGYSAATTLRIQQEAGVSRGRLLHQFPSREALLVAAVHHVAVARVDDLKQLDDWPRGPEERIDRAVEVMWSTFHQPYFWAATELWLAARANENLREALLPQERALGRLVKESIAAVFGADLCARPGYEIVREVLFASMRGIALTYALDPRDPASDPHVGEWKTIARRLLLDSES